jgi:hypothetical protein
MNEITELTRFREDIPDDPAARTRARNRLVSRTLGSQRPPRIPSRRRLIIATAAAVAVAATGTYALTRPAEPQGQPLAIGPVVVPIAFQIESDPPPAGDYLRDIAAQITDAPYDGRTGAYSYHHYQTWGEGGTGIDDYFMSYVESYEVWTAADGSGRYRHTFLGGEFPDEASRRYFESIPLTTPRESVSAFTPGFLDVGEVPADEPGLAALLGTAGGGEPDFGPIQHIYRDQVVPRDARAAILRLLADVPGFDWRGGATDRAGRSGIAISYDTGEPGYVLRWVLVFDPDTGELLSSETVDLQNEYLSYYALYLETGWTDDPGPEPTA